MSWRDNVLATADRLGVGEQARRARLAVAPYTWRRDDRTHQHLKILLTAGLRTSDATFVDVGAHEGRVLREALRIAPAGAHIAVEPLPGYAADLRREFPTVDVHEVALANEAGTTQFVFVPEHPGYSGIREQTYPGKATPQHLTVAMERLDVVLDGRRPDVIKIDVEGAEAEVVEGGMNAIREHRPMIVFEHHEASTRYGTTTHDLWKLLVIEADMRIFDVDGHGPYTLTELERTVARARIWDFVARP